MGKNFCFRQRRAITPYSPYVEKAANPLPRTSTPTATPPKKGSSAGAKRLTSLPTTFLPRAVSGGTTGSPVGRACSERLLNKAAQINTDILLRFIVDLRINKLYTLQGVRSGGDFDNGVEITKRTVHRLKVSFVGVAHTKRVEHFVALGVGKAQNEAVSFGGVVHREEKGGNALSLVEENAVGANGCDDECVLERYGSFVVVVESILHRHHVAQRAVNLRTSAHEKQRKAEQKQGREALKSSFQSDIHCAYQRCD